MMDPKNVIRGIVEESIKPGAEESPQGLLAAIYKQADPIRVICDHDTNISMSESFHAQFGYLTTRGALGKPQTTDEKARWAALLRWVLRELNEWTCVSDPSRHKLATVLFCALCCDIDNVLWNLLPDGLETNEELLSVLGNYVAAAKTEIGARFPGMKEPIWEKHIVEQLLKAESEGDWQEIGELWHCTRNSQLPNVFITTASRCLFRFDTERLTRSMETYKQSMLAAMVLDSLKIDQKLSIGVASDNPYVQFATALETFSEWHKGNCPTAREEELVKQLLLKVSGDKPRWRQWMKTFNRYPVRYPAVQSALGKTLAESSWGAIEAYLDSIELSASPAKSRILVAECLKAFREAAESKMVKRTWKYAYKRWLAWGFGTSEDKRHLFEIAFSELDYAVVGYITQCMTAEDRAGVQAEIFNRVTSIFEIWHSSLVTCISSWYRQLSFYQPYAQAEYVHSSGEQWLQINKNYWPFDPGKERYVMLMFRSN